MLVTFGITDTFTQLHAQLKYTFERSVIHFQQSTAKLLVNCIII